MQAEKGELRMVLEIKRAATGETEQVIMVGNLTTEELQKLGIIEDVKNGADTQHRSA